MRGSIFAAVIMFITVYLITVIIMVGNEDEVTQTNERIEKPVRKNGKT